MYISTNHQGGIGNVMFKLAAAIGLAKDSNVDYIFSHEFLREVDKIVTHGHPDFRRFYTNILRNIPFTNRIPQPYEVWNEPTFHYTPIPYNKSSNLLLTGHYQSEKYFINHKNFIVSLFECPEEYIKQITEWLPNISTYNSLHIRRGDYLNFPEHHPQQTEEYYKKSVELLGEDETYLIFSDDIEWCKTNFDFIKNKQFIENTEDWLDLYIMSLCKNNIITNSSFSWWGAYLNKNPNKKVIGPQNWFGPKYGHWNTGDILPKNWIKL